MTLIKIQEILSLHLKEVTMRINNLICLQFFLMLSVFANAQNKNYEFIKYEIVEDKVVIDFIDTISVSKNRMSFNEILDTTYGVNIFFNNQELFFLSSTTKLYDKDDTLISPLNPFGYKDEYIIIDSTVWTIEALTIIVEEIDFNIINNTDSVFVYKNNMFDKKLIFIRNPKAFKGYSLFDKNFRNYIYVKDFVTENRIPVSIYHDYYIKKDMGIGCSGTNTRGELRSIVYFNKRLGIPILVKKYSYEKIYYAPFHKKKTEIISLKKI